MAGSSVGPRPERNEKMADMWLPGVKAGPGGRGAMRAWLQSVTPSSSMGYK